MSDSDRSPKPSGKGGARMSTEALLAFLEARIAEDEEIARAANGPRWKPGDGNVSEGGLYALEGDTDDGWSITWFELGTANEAADGGRQLPRWPRMQRRAQQNADHAARHDPARVLAECQAKRGIITAWRAAVTELDDAIVAANNRPRGNVRLEVAAAVAGTYITIGRQLAAFHADHPDYQAGWAL